MFALLKITLDNRLHYTTDLVSDVRRRWKIHQWL